MSRLPVTRPGSRTTPARIRALPVLLAAAALLASPAARAEGDAALPPPLPLWEVGVLGATASQQAYPGASEQTSRTVALPYVIYRGRYLRADRDTVGLRALKTPRFELDIGFGGALGSDSSDIEARRGMPDLGTLVEAGPRLRWNLARDGQGGLLQARFPLRAVFDLDDGLAHRGLSFEPELEYERQLPGGSRWSVSAGLVAGNRKLADTLYGVAPAFATADRPAYQARAGLVAWRLGGSATAYLTPTLRVFGFVRADSVRGAANRGSPLVRDDVGLSAGIGVAWTFLRSSAPAVD